MIKEYNQTLPNLEQEIIGKIHKMQKRDVLIKQISYSLISIVSLAGTIFSGFYIVNVVAISGAFQYVSLVFYDMSVLAYWKEISLSIAESFPFFGFAIGLSVLSLFFWSILKSLRVQEFKQALA